MKNKLKVYPVMLPQQEDFTIGIIVSDNRTGHSIPCINENPKFEKEWRMHKRNGGCNFQPQFLYLVSNDPVNRSIKSREWCLVRREYKPAILTVEKYTSDKASWSPQKIEATTDPSLGLPLIPQSFIEEYVKKQGKIESVYVVMSMHNPSIIVKGMDDCVIILPTKDNFTRDEIKNIIRSYKANGPSNSVMIDEWFDLNY